MDYTAWEDYRGRPAALTGQEGWQVNRQLFRGIPRLSPGGGQRLTMHSHSQQFCSAVGATYSCSMDVGIYVCMCWCSVGVVCMCWCSVGVVCMCWCSVGVACMCWCSVGVVCMCWCSVGVVCIAHVCTCACMCVAKGVLTYRCAPAYVYIVCMCVYMQVHVLCMHVGINRVLL